MVSANKTQTTVINTSSGGNIEELQKPTNPSKAFANVTDLLSKNLTSSGLENLFRYNLNINTDLLNIIIDQLSK
ncbi:hypothetical protein [Candidatus Liberibacter sp.]|uniref:hypothetical protein n=1 Tax=Candidatus Liberibacter sp. TaxID=34022 RepID=UPI0015F3BBF5|nr:hypothetical protein [Candidatus Liberibacter sp.]MBA5724214.1 hypothetical protein [Candidatus Liberibacter sp.]